MTPEEKQKFLFTQTCTLIAARINQGANVPKMVIEKRFQETYKALQAELEKSYVTTTK